MPKAKKEKLQDVNDDSQPSIMDAVIDADPSKGSAARPSLVEEAPSRKSPGAPTTTYDHYPTACNPRTEYRDHRLHH